MDYRYISPEQVPVQYGGLSVDPCDCNPDFSLDDAASEITVKPGTKQTVEIIIYEVSAFTPLTLITVVSNSQNIGKQLRYGTKVLES